MEKYYFSVDGYRICLGIPVQTGFVPAKTKKLLSDIANDGEKIVLYSITEDEISRLVFRIDAERACAKPSFKLGGLKSPAEQEKEFGHYLTKVNADSLKEDDSPIIALYLPTSTEEESELERKMKELDNKKSAAAFQKSCWEQLDGRKK